MQNLSEKVFSSATYELMVLALSDRDQVKVVLATVLKKCSAKHSLVVFHQIYGRLVLAYVLL